MADLLELEEAGTAEYVLDLLEVGVALIGCVDDIDDVDQGGEVSETIDITVVVDTPTDTTMVPLGIETCE